MVTVLNVTARDESVVIRARKHHRTEHQPAPVSAELYCTLRDSSAKAFGKTNPWLKAGLKVAVKQLARIPSICQRKSLSPSHNLDKDFCRFSNVCSAELGLFSLELVHRAAFTVLNVP